MHLPWISRSVGNYVVEYPWMDSNLSSKRNSLHWSNKMNALKQLIDHFNFTVMKGEKTGIEYKILENENKEAKITIKYYIVGKSYPWSGLQFHLSKLACHFFSFKITSTIIKWKHYKKKTQLKMFVIVKAGKPKKKPHLPAPNSPSKMNSFSHIAVKKIIIIWMSQSIDKLKKMLYAPIEHL